MSINITESFEFIWGVCLQIFEWARSVSITLGPASFTLMQLFISLIAMSIVWSGVVYIFTGD